MAEFPEKKQQVQGSTVGVGMTLEWGEQEEDEGR